MGAERIVYGDKVINLGNHRRDGKRVYPAEGALGYLANGEIGVAVGLWKAASKILKVEFSSQPGYTYDFYGAIFVRKAMPRSNSPTRSPCIRRKAASSNWSFSSCPRAIRFFPVNSFTPHSPGIRTAWS